MAELEGFVAVILLAVAVYYLHRILKMSESIDQGIDQVRDSVESVVSEISDLNLPRSGPPSEPC